MNESLVIEGFGPLPVHRPGSIAEVCALVKEAAGRRQGVYPVGGRTMLDVGLPPNKPGIAIDTTRLNRVIDYPARDMTITVEAGITMAALRETLAAEGQWLPIDVPESERATIGGAVALNVSGPHRFGYGTLRDYVIGISFVTDEGDEVKGGGRVVKNVAGYDLMKLQVGAVGTLGLITQLTLKVKPRPESRAVVGLRSATANLAGILDALHASRSRPVVVDLCSDRDAWKLWVAFEEKAATVEWQTATLLEELKSAAATDVVVERDATAMQRLDSLVKPSDAPFAFQANVLPSQVAAFCGAAAAIPGLQLHAHALNGIVKGTLLEATRESALSLVNRLTPACEPHGNLAVRRCPTEWKASLPVWGKPGNDRELMHHVKRTLDPHELFNPGRF
ncbi:MAG TPA: FAD-binding oxidoreductase [Gemmataceae bacterium]|jgi:glycolate oxidase FAD binding subunit